MQLNFFVLKDLYAIYRLAPKAKLPDCNKSPFCSVTRTKDELSVVCKQWVNLDNSPGVNKDWRVLKIEGPLDFSMVGIIADISAILKRNKISIFTISTYDTDYILVKNYNLQSALEALKENSHRFCFEE